MTWEVRLHTQAKCATCNRARDRWGSEQSEQSRRLIQELEIFAKSYDLVPTSHRLRADESPPEVSLSLDSHYFPRFNLTESQEGGAIEMRILAFTHHLAGLVAGHTLHEP